MSIALILRRQYCHDLHFQIHYVHFQRSIGKKININIHFSYILFLSEESNEKNFDSERETGNKMKENDSNVSMKT